MNFTHRKIRFSIFFKRFIHFPGNNDLLEKEKGKWTQINTVPSARPRNRPGLPSLHSRCPHPGRNLGLGRQSHAAARARLSRPSVRSFRRNKTPADAAPQTLISFFTLCLSLRSLSAASTPSESERREPSHGVVASPLISVRAPQRVSAPPSSGLVAAPYRARGGRA